MQTATRKKNVLDTALAVLGGYAIAKGARIPARTSIREQISPEFLLALLAGYALGKGQSVFALDEEQWKTSEQGKHYEIETETGEITKGNIGQTTGPAVERQKAIHAKIDSIHIEVGKDNVLPNLNEETLQEWNLTDKSILLKQDVIARNSERHPDVSLKESNRLIGEALYNPMRCSPKIGQV